MYTAARVISQKLSSVTTLTVGAEIVEIPKYSTHYINQFHEYYLAETLIQYIIIIMSVSPQRANTIRGKFGVVTKL